MKFSRIFITGLIFLPVPVFAGIATSVDFSSVLADIVTVGTAVVAVVVAIKAAQYVLTMVRKA